MAVAFKQLFLLTLSDISHAAEIIYTNSVHTPIAPVTIGERRAFSRAVASGNAVTEFETHGKAAQEIRKLWQWIRQYINE